MSDAGKKQNDQSRKERIKEQIARLRPSAHRAALLIFRIASAGVENLRSDKRTGRRLKKTEAITVWLELLAFAVYLFGRFVKSRYKNYSQIYMDLLMGYIISRLPEEIEEYGRTDLRSEKGWEEDVMQTVSTRSLQYFSLEQEVCGATGSVEPLPPEGLFWEFGGVIAHMIGVPEDKATTEVVSHWARTSLTDIVKELASAPEAPST